MTRKWRIFIWSALALVIVPAVAFYVYTLDYYRADEAAVAALHAQVDEQRAWQQERLWVFRPAADQDRGMGFIFYPGGKVEATAYAPLLAELSHSGITCVLAMMPFNLAVLDTDAADEVYGLLPDIHSWYIGGHSLGGAMASSYANKHSGQLSGLILLGAYPVGQTELPVLALYGSEDQVLNHAKLEAELGPIEISGGNHAYFGNYGEQKGDGAAAITRDEQQRRTVEEILRFIADHTGE